MKINGVEIKGIKKAVGDYHKYEYTTIVYDWKIQEVACVGGEWYSNNCNEQYMGYCRYTDVIDTIKDIYGDNIVPKSYVTMARVKAALRDYII